MFGILINLNQNIISVDKHSKCMTKSGKATLHTLNGMIFCRFLHKICNFIYLKFYLFVFIF